MAKLKTEEKTLELADGAEIRETARELGVPFGCESGLCATCEVEVLEGYENLEEANEKEKLMGCEKPYRLACQTKIKSGEVKIKF